MNKWTKICLGLVVLQILLLIYVIVIGSDLWWVSVIGLLGSSGAFLWALSSERKLDEVMGRHRPKSS